MDKQAGREQLMRGQNEIQAKGGGAAAGITSRTSLKTTPVAGKPFAAAKASLKFERHFTRDAHARGNQPLDAAEVPYVKASSKIKDTDGKTVFEMKDVEVPAAWTQLAVDILVSKYFRKAGVPGTGHETSVRQVVRRIAHTLRVAGEQGGYFRGENAQVFEDELSHLLITQKGAFNSPVWFNLGLYAEYGIEGSGGNFA
jgi:ribonucleoside-diphosphate reductase alpha chain